MKSHTIKIYTGTVGKVKEDKETFLRFYHMKKAYLQTQAKVYIYKQQKVTNWKPSAREYPVMSYLSTSEGTHKLLIFAGINNEPIKEMVEVRVEDSDGSPSWKKLLEPEVKMENDNDYGRYGIWQVTRDEKIWSQEDALWKVIYYWCSSQRSSINEIIRFVPATGEFKTLMHSGFLHQSRRYHTASAFGHYIIMHGGVNDLGKVLSDVIVYNTIEQVWVPIEVVPESINKYTDDRELNLTSYKDDFGPKELYQHQSAAVFYNQRNELWKNYLALYPNAKVEDPLVKLPEIKWGSVSNFINREGIYFFGGKKSFGEITDQVWWLKMCDKIKTKVAKKRQKMKVKKGNSNGDLESPEERLIYAYFQWERIITEGKPPTARYGHWLHYHPKMNTLVIFGGKTDKKINAIWNDIFLLRMDNFLWIKVDIKGYKLGPWANFASSLVKSKLIIFGGISESMWPSNQFYVVELDETKVEELIKTDRERESQEIDLK
jgi:hypothetical protein